MITFAHSDGDQKNQPVIDSWQIFDGVTIIVACIWLNMWLHRFQSQPNQGKNDHRLLVDESHRSDEALIKSKWVSN